jgi:hypothetical protein
VAYTISAKLSLFDESDLVDLLANSPAEHTEMELRACWNFAFALSRSIAVVFYLVELIVAIV